MIYVPKSKIKSLLSAPKGNQSDSAEAPVSKKRKQSDEQPPHKKATGVEGSSSSGSSSSGPEEPMVPYRIYKKKVDISGVPRIFHNYEDYDDDEDSEEKDGYYEFPENDVELLDWWTPSTYQGSRKKQPEVYHVVVNVAVDADSCCTVEDCLNLLKVIGCENRFISCSVVSPRRFFVYLKEEEAAKLKAMDGVYDVFPDSEVWIDM